MVQCTSPNSHNQVHMQYKVPPNTKTSWVQWRTADKVSMPVGSGCIEGGVFSENAMVAEALLSFMLTASACYVWVFLFVPIPSARINVGCLTVCNVTYM